MEIEIATLLRLTIRLTLVVGIISVSIFIYLIAYAIRMSTNQGRLR